MANTTMPKIARRFTKTGIQHWYKEEHDLFGFEGAVADLAAIEINVRKWLEKEFDLFLPKLVYGSKCVHLEFKVKHASVTTVYVTAYEGAVGNNGLRITLSEYKSASELFEAYQAAEA